MTLSTWRKPITNRVRQRGHGLRSLITSGAHGWTWRLLCEDVQLASGYGDTKLDCLESVRLAKAARLGQPEPKPLKKRKSTRKEKL